jgi:hypothetical protein
MTLTEVISKVTRYAKKIIVNDTTASGDAVQITNVDGASLSITKNDPNPALGGMLKIFPNTGGDLVYDGGSDGIFSFNNTGSGFTQFNGAPIVFNTNTGYGGIPTAKVDVFGAIKASRADSVLEGGQIDFGQASNNNMAFSFDVLNSDASARFRITSAFAGELATILADGKIGIGTSSPAKTLHVNGGIRFQNLPTFANNAAAIAGGLVADDVYKTNVAGEVQLRIVI